MTTYVGRFAPTPSGPLHLGSIVTAVGSYLDARRAGGRWLVRIDDIDRRRVKAGAAADILRTLEWLGLTWDSDVIYQSQRIDAYAHALANLDAARLTYRCNCPRRILTARIYPGTCRNRVVASSERHAVRIRTDGRELSLRDRIQGERTWQLDRDVGDFIVYRADRVHAYHLATVLDDAALGVSHVVRGADLLESTLPQLYLTQCLDLACPAHAHLPLVRDQRGRKLSKRDESSAVLLGGRPERVLIAALKHLGQETGPGMDGLGCGEILEIAAGRWELGRAVRPVQPAAREP